MKGVVWARYTLEFKQEAVRLVRGGQTVCSVAKKSKAVSAEQMETAPLTAELAKTRVARDPKRSGGVIRESVAVRYTFIERHRKVWPIATHC